MRGDRSGSRDGIDFAGLRALTRRLEARVALQEQMEQILGEVRRQEAWATTDDRIDALLARTFPLRRGRLEADHADPLS